MLITFRKEIKNLTLDLSCFYVHLQSLLLKVHSEPTKGKCVVKPIEGWGFSSHRHGILDQVYYRKHLFSFWFSYQHVSEKDLLPDLFLQVHLTVDCDFLRQRAEGLFGLLLLSLSTSCLPLMLLLPPQVFTYRSQWQTGHVASPANDLTGLIVPFVCWRLSSRLDF